jgi:hypothetical protein
METAEVQWEEAPAHPPRWLAESIACAPAWPGVRPLAAVTESPVLRPDGTVLQEPGYDATTGVLYTPGGAFPQVPGHPTKADAEHARDELLDVVSDFPFKADVHRAAWVASVLTPLARFAFDGPAPGFLFDANTRGTGKGLLAEVTALVASGRGFAVAGYSANDEEMRKVITSIAMTGESMVLFDNVTDAVGGAALDRALTCRVWEDRLLGGNNIFRGPLAATFYVTGNNIVLKGDAGRRWNHIRLESPEERPEERAGFQHPDLLAWVRQERPRLLVAALTILSAYCHAGWPDMSLPPWDSFEGWSALVRAAVVWAGLPDPAASRQELVAVSDGDAQTLRGLLAAWAELDPDGHGLKVGEALKAMEANKNMYPTARAVFAEMFGLTIDKTPDARRLGKKLKAYEKRFCGGRCLDSREDAHTKVKIWFVRNLNPPSGTGGVTAEFAGFGGGSASPPCAPGEVDADDSEINMGGNTPCHTPQTPHTKPAWKPARETYYDDLPA